MTKKEIRTQLKNMQATIEAKNKSVIDYYGFNNTEETTRKMKEWLEANKSWHIEMGPMWHQYGIDNKVMINFYE